MAVHARWIASKLIPAYADRAGATSAVQINVAAAKPEPPMDDQARLELGRAVTFSLNMMLHEDPERAKRMLDAAGIPAVEAVDERAPALIDVTPAGSSPLDNVLPAPRVVDEYGRELTPVQAATIARQRREDAAWELEQSAKIERRIARQVRQDPIEQLGRPPLSARIRGNR